MVVMSTQCQFLRTNWSSFKVRFVDGEGGLNVNSHKEWLLGDRIKLDEVFPNIPEAGHSVGEQLIPKASGVSWGNASLLYISG